MIIVLGVLWGFFLWREAHDAPVRERLVQAQSLLEKGQFPQAIAPLREATQMAPENALAWQPGSSAPAATVKNRPHCALFRNKGDGTFQDVSRASGFDKDLGYGQGVAVGDFEGDGFDDVFLTSYGGNHLFHNLKGTGKFEDVTAKMGLAKIHGQGYATSAAWGDYDNDRRLDLYVCYYAKWSHALDKQCRDEKTGELDYCRPQIYAPETHQLWHNSGQKIGRCEPKSGHQQSLRTRFGCGIYRL